jgi:hypothetical protein
MRGLVWVILASALASAASAAGALSVAFIRVTPPSGWSVQTTEASTRLLSSPGSDAKILIFAGPQSAQPLDLATNFSTSVKGMLQGRKIVQSSAQVFNKTPDGSPYIAQNFAADDAKKNRVFVSVTVANVHDRLAVFSLMSGTQAAFDKHSPAYNKMLSEVAFSGSAAAVADNPLDRPNGRVEPPKTTVNPASNPDAIFPNPAKVKASEQARMKPGVVSGNVYGADGKPWNMPGSRVTVSVWGVTGNEDLIGVGGPPGGERTSYNINVDQRGHYELKIAGGGFRIKAEALIPYGGTIVPVDLDALDGVPSADYDLNSFRGIVKDFGLKLTGPRAGGAAMNGWNGFSVNISDASNIMSRSWQRYPAGTHLHILLTPIAPLLDGSAGWPIDVDLDITYMGEHCDHDGCAWSGVPYAKYRATAKYVLPNKRVVPARLDVDTAGSRLATSTIVEFKVQQDKFTGPSVVTPTIYVNDEPQ